MAGFEARGAGETQLRREARENKESDGMSVLDEGEKAGFLRADRAGEVRRALEIFSTGNLRGED